MNTLVLGARKGWPVAICLGLLAVALDFPAAGAEITPPAASGRFTNYVQTMPGSTVKFEMVAIPGGTVTVGSPENEAGRDTNDLACRTITVKPFWMGRCEVSWTEYLPYVWFTEAEIVRWTQKLEGKIDRDGISRPTKPWGSVYRGRGQKGYPAIGMGLPAAYEYCRWLSRRTGLHYRLPTEDEWEFACRAGSTNAYFWGNDSSVAPTYGWFAGNAKETTQPIGRLKPNPFGLFDIVGNVAEWCFDPQKPPPFVARGGAFTEPVKRLRCASRMVETPEWNELDPNFPQSIWWLSAADWVGFRVVRSLDEAAAEPPVAELYPAPVRTVKPAAVKANYLRFCASCHGVDGKGQTGHGRQLKARDYTSPQVKASLKPDAMRKAITEGLIVAEFMVMSPFADHFSAEEIAALVAYMQAFK